MSSKLKFYCGKLKQCATRSHTPSQRVRSLSLESVCKAVFVGVVLNACRWWLFRLMGPWFHVIIDRAASSVVIWARIGRHKFKHPAAFWS